MITLTVAGKPLQFKIDTGASLSLVSEETYPKLWPNTSLKDSSVKLETYTQEWILCCSSSLLIVGVTWPLKLSFIITTGLSSLSDSLVFPMNGTIILLTYQIMVS